MGKSQENRNYDFDATPLLRVREPWNPLAKLSSMLPGRQFSEEQHLALERFGASNGLQYHPVIEQSSRPVRIPSLLIHGTCATVFQANNPRTGPPAWGEHSVEIGNHGWRYWKAETDGSPSRRGYIANKHGLDLPRLLLSSREGRALTLVRVASGIINIAGMFDFERADVDRTAIEDFRYEGIKLERTPGSRFDVVLEKSSQRADRKPGGPKLKITKAARDAAKLQEELDRERDAAWLAQANGMLAGPALAHLSELAESFDLEVGNEWIFAYSSFGEIATTDPEIWEWTFAMVSRLVDVVHCWGADLSSLQEQRWYTLKNVERPSKMDGELQVLKPNRD